MLPEGRGQGSARPGEAASAARAAPQISFIIPVRNDAARLARCLDSIAAASVGIAHQVIVVDHASTDGSRDVALASGATTLRGTGRNVASLRNAGASRAAAPLLAFVDADNVLAPGWTGAALDSMLDERIGGAGAAYHAPADGTWVQRTYDALRRHPELVEPAEWFGAGNMVVRRKAFSALGGFDESLESCEDVDFCFRLRTRGWTLMNVPTLRNVHLGDPPTLRRLFTSELWRGRDNLRVSLRAPWSIRNIVSTMTPVAQLASLPAAAIGGVAGGPIGWSVFGIALAAGVAPIVGRTAAMTRNAAMTNPGGISRCFAVAATYDAARALALIVHAGHHRQHGPEAAAP